ncbi:hypothetical protein [Okeania sp. SIO2B9]|uniref:hypothetical protein n=1 Tax=Okeania sp. SIO2B9 TaxID=2607782 RepID=UPI0013B7ED22|nr:hypothetical protein [Okeania sp. SIO2B9]NET18194.1 hypothetical protein [Okeania sp. SIO1H5]
MIEGDGKMGRWGDGEMGRWGDGKETEIHPLSWSIGYGEETRSCRPAPKIAIPPYGKLRFFLGHTPQTYRAALTELCASKTTAFFSLERRRS